MTVEFQLLIWSLGLTFVQMLVALIGTILYLGLPKVAGNRERIPELPGWPGRRAAGTPQHDREHGAVRAADRPRRHRRTGTTQ